MSNTSEDKYRINLSRNRTKKWTEASNVDYGGGDWGDDEEYDDFAPGEPALPTVPQPTGSGRQSPWTPAATLPSQTQRNFATLAMKSSGPVRSSFVQGDDNAYLPAAGFEDVALQTPPASQNSPPAPSASQHGHDTSIPHQTSSNPVHVSTGIPHSQGDRRQPPSASPVGSAALSQSNPGQQQPPPTKTNLPVQDEHASDRSQTQTSNIKPLQFIRPADIYKRMEEEREKERQSIDSSRPSTDLGRDTPDDSKQSTVQQGTSVHRRPLSVVPKPESDSSTGRETAIGPVSGTTVTTNTNSDAAPSEPSQSHSLQRSGTGQTNASQATSPEETRNTDIVSRQASSVYSGRRDPVSASSIDAPQLPLPPVAEGRTPITARPASNTYHIMSPIEYATPIRQEGSARADGAATRSEALKHTPSVGYTSVVQKAFDDEDQKMVSASETMPRSNSASTSGLSPIISRAPDSAFESSNTAALHTQTIPEEPARSRPESSATLKGATQQSNDVILQEPIVAPGFRRNSQPPSPDNSPARRPQSVTLSHMNDPESVAISDNYVNPHVGQEASNLVQSDASEVDSSSGENRAQNPSAEPQSAADGLQKQPHSSLDANPRSEPHNSVLPASTKDHSEAFRPRISENLQSHTKLPGDGDGERTSSSRPPFLQDSGRLASSEGIPTATATRSFETGPEQPTPGAFNKPTLTSRDSWEDSDSQSEDEALMTDKGRVDDLQENSLDFASEASTLSSTRQPKGLAKAPGVQGSSAGSESDRYPTGNQAGVDLPAPLRTARLGESAGLTTRTKPLDPDEDDAEQDPDQLQDDIVKSLTPRPSNIHDSSLSAIDELGEPPVSSSVGGSGYGLREFGNFAGGNEFDQIGSVSANTVSNDAQGSTKPTIRTVTDDTPSSVAASGKRPLLEQRFSWEAESEPTRPEPTVHDVVTDDRADWHSSEDDAHDLLNAAQAPAPVATDVLAADVSAKASPQLAVPSTETTKNADPPSTSVNTTSFPKEKVDFRSILGYGDHARRIRAFEDNRKLYAEPNGLLDAWLSSMNIPEHADVFIASRHARPSAGVSPDTKQALRKEPPASSGTKQMQEDGRRFLAAAGKYGGKAGSAAKGFFARGKDKLRTASASDKVLPSNRSASNASDVSAAPASPPKKPTVTSITPHIATSNPESSNASNVSMTAASPPKQPAFISVPPHLATPALESPSEEVSWSLISSTIDQMFGGTSTLSTVRSFGTMDGSRGEPGSQGISVTPKPGDSSIPPVPPKDAQFQKQGNKSEVDEVLRSAVQRAVQHDPPVRPRRPSEVRDNSGVGQNQEGETRAATIAQTDATVPTELVSIRHADGKGLLPAAVIKEAEALQDREAAAKQGHSSLPPYSSPAIGSATSRLPSGTTATPNVDLKNYRVSESGNANHQWSSIGAGVDTMSTVPSYRPGSGPPPISPPDKTSEPNILDHPAYRNIGHGEVRTDALDNPLPSAKRDMKDIEQARQGPKPPAPENATNQGYVIPGPYKREFKSPRPKPGTEAFQSRQEPVVAPSTMEPPAPPLVSTTAPSITTSLAPAVIAAPGQLQPPSQSSLDARPYEDPPRSASADERIPRSGQPLIPGGRVFSSSPRRDEPREVSLPPTAMSNFTEKRKRRVLFRLGSDKSDSNTSAFDSVSEENITSNASAHRKLFSTDLLKSAAKGIRFASESGRRRTSGIAGFLSRATNRDRSRPSTSMSQRSDASNPGHQSNDPYMRYQAMSPSPDLAIHVGNNTSHDQVLFPRHPAVGGGNDVAPTSTSEPGADALNEPDPTHQEGRAYYEHSPDPDANHVGIYEDRVQQNLPLDTYKDSAFRAPTPTGTASTPYGSTTSVPYQSASTPVPVTRARKDISYGQDRPYLPPASTPDARQTEQQRQQHMADHVKDLHKRSRSPRLGRPPSSEFVQASVDRPAAALNVHDPAASLGTFSNKRSSLVGPHRPVEEQEKPWTLTLPKGHDDDSDDKMDKEEERSATLQEQTPAVQANVAVIYNQGDQSSYGREPGSNLELEKRQSPPGVERTPSPFLAAAEDRSLHPQMAAQRFLSSQGPPSRSTTPLNTPPTRHSAQLIQEAVVKATPVTVVPSAIDLAPPPAPPTVQGDTIMTTTTTTRGTNGVNVSTYTITNPGPKLENGHDTGSLHEGVAPRSASRLSQARSPAPVLPAEPSTYATQTVQPSPTNIRELSSRRRQQQLDDASQKEAFIAAELPGSKPDGYESEDEPIMSATAYPGQEWMPSFDGYGQWED